MVGIILIALTVAATALVMGVVYWRVLKAVYSEPFTAEEEHCVETKDNWHIRLYRYRARTGPGEPVLLCHGFLANHLTFCIPRGHSIVDALTEAGYDCWLIDLRGSRSSTPPFGVKRRHGTLDEVLYYDIPSTIDFVCEQTGFRRVHWIGHSLGGMLLYAYNVVFGPGAIASGTTLGAPPGFQDTRVGRPKWVLPIIRLLPGIAEFLIRGFIPLLHVMKPGQDVFPMNWSNLHPNVNPRLLFNMLEGPALPMVWQLVSWVRTNSWTMMEGQFDIVGTLRKLEFPLLAIFAENDPFIPQHNARSFFLHLRYPDKRMMVLSREKGASADYGHVDLAFAVNGAEDVHKPIVQWLREHPADRGEAKSKNGEREKPSRQRKAARENLHSN